MNSLVKVFSNFKEFYSEINGATLTGAIDVIVVEQPDGTFLCSPFHVRFGKLGVLRSREKIVDIEVNGEPVDIHMKLGESGEAFFVEECQEIDLIELPEHMATSPLPTDDFSKFIDDKIFVDQESENSMSIVKPRRNSIDFSTEMDLPEKKFENHASNYSNRRHTDNTMERRDLSAAKKEYTTQKIRQEWAEHEEQIFGNETKQTNDLAENDAIVLSAQNSGGGAAAAKQQQEQSEDIIQKDDTFSQQSDTLNRDETKSKKKRRKKSMIKKKAAQRKSSSSSSVGSTLSDNNDAIGENIKTTESSNSDSIKTEIGEEKCVSELMEKDTTEDFKQNVESVVKDEDSKSTRMRDLDIHFFSDTELATGKSPQTSRPPTPIQSDSELEMSHRENFDQMKDSASWKWGELPTQPSISNEANMQDANAQRNSMLSSMFSFMKQSKKLRKSQSDGIYLSDLDTEQLDPKIAALYFPPKKSNFTGKMLETEDDERESGNGTSIIPSPSSIESPKSLDSDFDDGKHLDSFRHLDFVELSLCGGLDQNGPTDEQFNQNIVQYSEVCRNPSIFSLPSLVVRLNGKHYSWAVACPIVMSFLAFQKPLTNDAIEQIINANKPQDSIESERKRSSWWYWRRSENKSEPKHSSFEQQQSLQQQQQQPHKIDDLNISQNTVTQYQQIIDKNTQIKKFVDFHEHSDEFGINTLVDGTKSNELYKKSLRLSSDQIAGLNLKNGMNEISFSVTTAYQGTSRCKCYLFKWKHNDQVVISDIDGTITKSDVLGHILPMVGKDWAQIGVAQLFSKIEENGYKVLYLSARAIGQSRVTREYLRSIRQGDVKLPDGPLLLNPTSLISALHREVIEKKPEQFKIACLSDIQALFPQKNPFYAGYGNKINDVYAYRAVGIPIKRIFTINPKGELKHELTQTFQSTYCNMTYIVDQLFPPTHVIEESIEFSNINYWREPFVDIDTHIEFSSELQ